MKSWKLQQLEKDLVKIVNNTLRGEIQEIVNPGGENCIFSARCKRYRKYC
ncbi:hypothetical protein OTUT144_0521 [Orientia tsutsugamushi str. UT144]|uniref:Uncharacterized protein n=1 Tax=Orientia tsutsugamushi str. UT144 TaxID=1441384 RepID=A0A0F3RMP8_ORITS|nr:hypothetical protein [Orientia tsutsugamushi]KJW06796.1 hypothetical protein OTUT144_1158 [Orientia tsutsugamushi str. UT144]KJW07442.1 hypothetical protein OTUT144_0521 [Orientia tsutsugamushi str. UT144]